MAKKIDFTVTRARIVQYWNGGFEVAWRTKSAGFGYLVVSMRNGKMHVDNECMSRKFVSSVMKKLVDEAKLKDPPTGFRAGKSKTSS
jgi:hypothetical protein